MGKNVKVKLDKKVLKALKTDIVLVFGSYVAGLSHPQSDIDIGIVFENDQKRKENPVEVYSDLYEELRKKFKTDKIDVVYLADAPLSLQFKAINDGVILYEKDANTFANYREKVMKFYFDFKFVEDIFNQALKIA